MLPVIVTLAILTVAGGWTWIMYKRSVARPLAMALSATAAGVVCAVAGLAGYTLNEHESSWRRHRGLTT
jgi:hypothetical protein